MMYSRMVEEHVAAYYTFAEAVDKILSIYIPILQCFIAKMFLFWKQKLFDDITNIIIIRMTF